MATTSIFLRFPGKLSRSNIVIFFNKGIESSSLFFKFERSIDPLILTVTAELVVFIDKILMLHRKLLFDAQFRILKYFYCFN